jgi:hypothetical protein
MVVIALMAMTIVRVGLTLRGAHYAVVLDARAPHPLQIWRGGRKIADSLRMAYHPWSLQVADVDGDGTEEIAVGLTKATRYLPFPHRTLFIMRFDGRQIVRKWAGSTMGRPLLEFCFGPKEKGKAQTLFTLETALHGGVALSAHAWTGFGFRKIGQERIWKGAKGLSFRGDRLILRVDSHSVSIPWRALL